MEGQKQPHPNFSAMGVGQNVEGLPSQLWIKFQKQSVFAEFTPFIVSLASGRLELETFCKYIAQDVYFIRAFLQAYDMAEYCADDDDAKAGICYLRNWALEEMKMYDLSMKEWGVDLAKESSPNPATLKYTDFLVATASGKFEGVKDPAKIATPFEKIKLAAYTLGVMTPCMRLYAFLGKKLQSCLDPAETSHPYKKWIDGYASESFEAVAVQTEEMLDKLSISLTGEELKVIERLYHQAMNLLIEFLSAQPIVHRTVVPFARMQEPAERHLVIFSDFDLTCTCFDSSAILAEISILIAPKANPSGPENPIVPENPIAPENPIVPENPIAPENPIVPENPIARMSSADLRNLWDVISRQYTEEHEQCIESIMPGEIVETFNHEGLCKALERLSDFEKRANARVIESGVLKGLDLEGIKRAGERLLLQDGCVGFFQQLVKKKEELNADIHILSYCWCGDLIRSAFSSGGLNVLNVHSNEFAYEESVSTGEILLMVGSPMDKLQNFKEILKNCNEDCKNLSVYVGRSVGDLLCLLEADVGIVFGSNPTLRRVGSQFHISFVPLFPALVKKQKEFVEGDPPIWKGLTGTLYTVSSWEEIHAFILWLYNHL